jgi:hypothetical protein
MQPVTKASGRIPMNNAHAGFELPDVSLEQQFLVDLAKRVRKLRWIGMEDEARILATELEKVPPAIRHSILGEQFCTD